MRLTGHFKLVIPDSWRDPNGFGLNANAPSFFSIRSRYRLGIARNAFCAYFVQEML